MRPLRLETFLEEMVTLVQSEEEAACNRKAQANYDIGFQAGWEEAQDSHRREAQSEEAEVVRSLQAIEFTFHDARAAVLHSLAPLFEELTALLLPKIGMTALPQLISEALMPFAEEISAKPIEVLIHPSMRETVERHFASFSAPPLVLSERADQPVTRVSLCFEDRETSIDIQAAVDAIEQVLQNYFPHSHAQDARHG